MTFHQTLNSLIQFPTSHLEASHIAGYIVHQHNYLKTLNPNHNRKIVIYFCYFFLYFSRALTLFGNSIKINFENPDCGFS